MAENNGSANLAWFLTGAILGATTTLLLAPQTGKKTRKYIRDRASDGKDNLERSGQEALKRGRELYNRGKELTNDAITSLETTRNAAKEELETDTGKTSSS